MTQTTQSPAEAIETAKIRRLRAMVDLIGTVVRQSDMTLPEAVSLVRAVRAQALFLFPGKEQTYDLIYAPRFARMLREKYRIEYPEN